MPPLPSFYASVAIVLCLQRDTRSHPTAITHRGKTLCAAEAPAPAMSQTIGRGRRPERRVTAHREPEEGGTKVVNPTLNAYLKCYGSVNYGLPLRCWRVTFGASHA
jgi:hypothetical protein